MTVGIIGLGRFGTLLQKILSEKFEVIGYDPQQSQPNTLESVLKQPTIFICVPIRAFEPVIQDISPKLNKKTTIIDVCSVKVHPVEVMKKVLPAEVDIIATHPLFGPDSYSKEQEFKIMMANIRNQYERYNEWKYFFNSHNLVVEEMSVDEHDQYMAQSQGITHLIGRTLADMQIQPTPINTAGYEQLLKIMHHTCNDTWELFLDMQRYNPYSKTVNHQLLETLRTLIHKVENSH